jgi:hypothetical protein
VRRSSGRVGIGSGGLAGRVTLTLLGVCCALAFPASALANNLFVLDGNPEVNAVIVTESSGTAYAAWERAPAISTEADTTLFCKIPRGGTCTAPIVLPLPSPGTSDEEDDSQAFPVLGTRPGVVYVVAPRYVPDDTVIWTSTNGGVTFSAPKKVDTAGDKTGVDDVLLNPNKTATEKEPTADFFDIAADNAGFSFAEVGNTMTKAAAFSFASPGPFPDEGSLGFMTGSHDPVEAYFNLNTHDEVQFYANSKGGAADEEKNWTGPKRVSEGYSPRLASGPAGLFMLSSDFLSGESNPAVLELRKFNEAADAFEAPTVVTSNLAQGLTSEVFENPETGYLYAVWPVASSGNLVLYLAESTDGGKSFHGEREVAVVNGGFTGPPRLAVASDGRGWLSYRDELGDEVANLATNTTVSTSLSGGSQNGASIAVPQGTPVTDTATIGGSGGPSAAGSVSYEIFGNSSCAGAATAAGSGTVSSGIASGSSATVVAGLAPGKYYWRASYSGDAGHEPSTSPCGGEILTVLAPTSTSTAQSGGGITGASVTLPQGTAVTDQARISGALAANATGTVTYTLYKDSKCTAAVTSSAGSVVKGVASSSSAVKLKPGTYYWKAVYGGDAADVGSTSACGSEVLVVAELDSNIGLPSSKMCLSRRKFVVHPRAPKGVKLVSVVIQINGKTVKTGKLSKDRTSVSLVGLPKGTFRVSLITRSSTGKLYEDIRTFHTCVPGKHRKKK